MKICVYSPRIQLPYAARQVPVVFIKAFPELNNAALKYISFQKDKKVSYNSILLMLTEMCVPLISLGSYSLVWLLSYRQGS